MRLHDFFEYHARENPESVFAIFEGRTITYGKADQEVNRMANAFVNSGLQKGDRFAYLSKNSIEYALMYLAASKAGVVSVPLNYRLTPNDWAYIINDSQSKMLMASGEFVKSADSITNQLEVTSHFIAINSPAPSGWDDYRSWLSDDTEPPDLNITSDDDVVQMYTSGTTGNPKGAITTHSSFNANIIQCNITLKWNHDDSFLVAAPMYHIAGALIPFIVVSEGGRLYIQEDFDPTEVIRTLSEDGITSALLVPAMIQACLVQIPDGDGRTYPSLKGMLYGASPIAEQTLKRAMAVFECDFTQGYGMTETGVLTFLTADDHEKALEGREELLLSAGRAACGTQIRIVDEDDNVLPSGVVGEIVAKGPQVMKGYWNLPEVTAETLRDGWMHTGDAGYMDEEGYVFAQDRIKDLIVSGGENVYPVIVENVLFKHPVVADASVFGIPDEQWGETVKAVVVLRDGQTSTEKEIIDFCRDKLAGFQRPRSVDFVDALPRNASGKVLKRELREPYWERHSRRIAGA